MEADTYSEPCETFKMKCFPKIVNGFQPSQMSDRVLNTPLEKKHLIFKVLSGSSFVMENNTCSFCIQFKDAKYKV